MILGVSVVHDGVVYKEAKPLRHHNVLHKMYDCHGISQPPAEAQGFYSEDTDFISREDALKRAMNSGQITKHDHKTKLFSEDLW